MYQDHRVIAVTPAGRKRYLEVLLPYLLSQRDVIDEYRLWVNTTNARDIQYLRQIADEHKDFIKLIWGSMPINPSVLPYTIHQFFQSCVQPNTIYIRFDDDIVYVHPEAVRELCRYRLANTEPFIVYANTINNSICTHIHMRLGAIGMQSGFAGYDCVDRIGWESGETALLVHETFIESIKERDLNRFLFSQWIMPHPDRVSINCFCWTGDDFKKFEGRVGRDEEDWLSVTHPRSIGLSTAICGSALVVHYAYHTQRAMVDTTQILDVYKMLSTQLNKPEPPVVEKQLPDDFAYSTVLYV